MSEQFLDTNVPGNPAYHFTIQPPVREGGAGWLHRPKLVPGAALATRLPAESILAAVTTRPRMDSSA